MQLGVRWQAGEQPHRSAPPSLHLAIAEQERLHPAAGSWTLTWLEGRPRCALDDVALLSLDAEGRAILVNSVSTAPEDSSQIADGLEADDNDDWLN